MFVIQPIGVNEFACYRENDKNIQKEILFSAYRLGDEELSVAEAILLANPKLIVLNYRDSIDLGDKEISVSERSYNEVMKKLEKYQEEFYVIEHLAFYTSNNYKRSIRLNLFAVKEMLGDLGKIIKQAIRRETIDEILKSL